VKSDRELIESINAGDADAFETLYQRHRDWVYRLAWRFTGNHQDALDVLQETFTYLLQRFPGFELTAALTTFLYPVVKHVSLNLRRRSPHPASDDLLAEIPNGSHAHTSRAELGAALSALPPAQREVVLMRFLDGLSLAEIGKALDIPLNTAKSRLYNALQKLRDDPRTQDYFLD
jgi:RNA polymerase sigma-70 factor (ECF subfamily)